jgi:hypothetical protein
LLLFGTCFLPWPYGNKSFTVLRKTSNPLEQASGEHSAWYPNFTPKSPAFFFFSPRTLSLLFLLHAEKKESEAEAMIDRGGQL